MSTDATGYFTGRAEGYAKFRPCYPGEYIRYLMEANLLAEGCAVADVGSGTGILSGSLLERGLRVFAVEPNADMRAEAERRLGLRPGFVSVDGTAENTGLGAGSVALVTAAQAFHWFDAEKFRLECLRILKSGARVSLVWNSRDISSPAVQENEAIIAKYCLGFAGFSGGIKDKPETVIPFFRLGTCEYRIFRNDLRYDLDAFLGRNLSGSYAPIKGDENYLGYVMELTDLFGKYSENGMLFWPQITESYLGFV